MARNFTTFQKLFNETLDSSGVVSVDLGNGWYSVDSDGQTISARYSGADTLPVGAVVTLRKNGIRSTAPIIIPTGGKVGASTKKTSVTVNFNARTPRLSNTRTDDGSSTCIGAEQTVRVYYFEVSGTYPSVETSTYAVANLVSTGTETITETVTLKFGRGSRSLWDTDGITDVFRSAYQSQYFAAITDTYSVPYRDYVIYGTDDVAHNVHFYYGTLGSEDASTDYAFTSTDCGATDPEQFKDESSCETAGNYWWNNSCHADQPGSAGDLDNETDCTAYGYYWYDGACHAAADTTDVVLWVTNYFTDADVAGVSVYIAPQGGSLTLQGTTGSDGKITLTDLIVGASYDLKMTKSGFLDSDADAIANDSFTVS